MKLAIATDGTTLESEVCPSFGRTETFLIVDTETLEVEVMPNAAAQAQGGAGIRCVAVRRLPHLYQFLPVQRAGICA